MAKGRPSNLARSSRPDRERMDSLAGNVTKCGIHQALALQT